MAAATTESVVGQAGWAAANQASFQWQGLRFELLAGRALWDPARALLLVADLHMGKAESFQARGIPLPSDGDAETLNALLQLAHRWRPRQVIVLGDLVHERLGLTEDLRQKLAALPALLGCPLRLIGGNHDRDHWHEGLPQEPPQALGPLWLSNGPDPRAGLLNVCGHLHPVVQLGRKADRPDADAIFLACGNWLTADIVADLERATGKPVLTTNNCAIWAMLRILGGHDSVKGYGTLLEKHLKT